MAVTGICAQLRAWGELYPDPSAPAEQNVAARANEDERLAKFAGLDVLDRDQVIQLIGWKFQSMAHRKALAMRGISPQRWAGPAGAARLRDCAALGAFARMGGAFKVSWAGTDESRRIRHEVFDPGNPDHHLMQAKQGGAPVARDDGMANRSLGDRSRLVT